MEKFNTFFKIGIFNMGIIGLMHAMYYFESDKETKALCEGLNSININCNYKLDWIKVTTGILGEQKKLKA